MRGESDMTKEDKMDRAIEMYFEGDESLPEIAKALDATIDEVVSWTGILEE